MSCNLTYMSNLKQTKKNTELIQRTEIKMGERGSKGTKF